MNHRLSRENVCEMDLTLARAGLLELTDDQIKNMFLQSIATLWENTGKLQRPASIQNITGRKWQ